MADLDDNNNIIKEFKIILYSNTNTKVPPNVSLPRI